MRKLEANIQPLQESNAELSEKNGMLQVEKRLLDEDVRRLKTCTQVSGSPCLCIMWNLLVLSPVDLKHKELTAYMTIVLQQLLSQQKDSDQEECKRLHSERETHLKRIQQLTEETSKLKSELARSVPSSFNTSTSKTPLDCILTLINIIFSIFLLLNRSQASISTAQSQVQNLQDNMGKITTERDNLKKDLEAKTVDIQEKLKTITQVKKIGRRYKTQYEELKEQHEKVRQDTLLVNCQVPCLPLSHACFGLIGGGRGCC